MEGKICLGILAKDEEQRLEGLLWLCKPYVSHIVVIVDKETEDRSFEVAEEYADKVLLQRFSGSFGKERNKLHAAAPPGTNYMLHLDSDERPHPGFLSNMASIIEARPSASYKFPRIELPTRASWPDYQVRLVAFGCVWRRKTHEIPYHPHVGKPIDKIDCIILDEYPIVHLPRREDIKRGWW